MVLTAGWCSCFIPAAGRGLEPGAGAGERVGGVLAGGKGAPADPSREDLRPR